MKLRYLKGIFRTHDLRFISAENVFGDYYTIKLQTPYPMEWESGQHGAFTLPGKKVKGKPIRAFTVASVPSEYMVLVGTRTGSSISAFKEALISMQEGDIVRIRGPLGWFVLRDNTSPIVLLATGVGITPMRSILYALKENTSRPIHLIHSSSEFHLFSDEFKALEKGNSQMKLTFVPNRVEFKEALTAVALTYSDSAFYYVSGAPDTVRATKKLLKGMHIPRRRIITESFMGY